MKQYTVTFKGFGGNRNRSVLVSAEDKVLAEDMARKQNPGWDVVIGVLAVGKWEVRG